MSVGKHRLAGFAVFLKLDPFLVVGLGVSEFQHLFGLQSGLDLGRIDSVGRLIFSECIIVIFQQEEGVSFLEVRLCRAIGRTHQPHPVLAHIGIGSGNLCVLHQRRVQITVLLKLLGLAKGGTAGSATGKKQGRQHQDGDRFYFQHKVLLKVYWCDWYRGPCSRPRVSPFPCRLPPT